MPEDRTEPTAGASAAPAAAVAPTVGRDEPAAGREAPGGRPGGTPKTWWLVAPAFVAGLFAGAILLGLLREDPPPIPATATESPATGAAGTSGPDEVPGASAEITVNEACLRVVNGTRDLVDVIGDLGDAAAGLDISGLDQSIRELQPLERRLRDDLDGCETDTTLPGDLSPTGTPEPTGTAEPTATTEPTGTTSPSPTSGSPATSTPAD